MQPCSTSLLCCSLTSCAASFWYSFCAVTAIPVDSNSRTTANKYLTCAYLVNIVSLQSEPAQALEAHIRAVVVSAQLNGLRLEGTE
ncbi:hypothetical protein EXIGLDRAFT_335149 [Exidia glandulosa HHB12029]|uniref:Secreted protein n=1 Tax=Exidia glandulosa HHB12029 TaxID=1314781 RepID=A0A165CMC7_EXIGL|nr:hypothetical protein EXIGLDRAFT_335149 [Exidia glandulosa HHB12029]